MLYDANKAKQAQINLGHLATSRDDSSMAFNLPTEEEAQAILADPQDGGIIMHEFLEAQMQLFDTPRC